MNNNETILAFLKANLGKDFNNDYNEVGCAQTVNNILKMTLGYVAGGGPSTAKMLQEISQNKNFQEVTKFDAKPGDVLLSATGTGNGKIAHGHVGFLGEGGAIYSNNSYKDMLDDHLTAKQWREYFVLKGGFPVKYYRAIGEPTVDKKVVPTPEKDVQYTQSGNAQIMSSRIKSLLWRTAMMSLAFAITSLASNLSTLNLPKETTVALGLVLGEVSKYLNNRYSK